MNNMLKYDVCRCCGSKNLNHWLSLPNSPVANALFSKPDLYRHPLELNSCDNCGHLQLASAPDPDGVFADYRYKSGVSKSFKNHFNKYAFDIITQYGKGIDGAVLEIGSNDGYLLEQFKKMDCTVLGVEPSKHLVQEHTDKGVDVINDFFTVDLVDKHSLRSKFDIVCANNVLAHIPDTLGVVQAISLSLRTNGILVAECGHQEGITSGKYLDNVYHEHIDYYTPYSFSKLLERAGLIVEDVTIIESHGISFRIVARKRTGTNKLAFERLDWEWERTHVESYISAREDKMRDLIGDRPFVAYGAAAKAVTSLYTLGLVNNKLIGVVDDNDLKQGYYFPGTDILITNPADLDKDAFVVVTAWNVFLDIKEKLVSRGHRGEIICMQ